MCVCVCVCVCIFYVACVYVCVSDTNTNVKRRFAVVYVYVNVKLKKYLSLNTSLKNYSNYTHNHYDSNVVLITSSAVLNQVFFPKTKTINWDYNNKK